MSDPIELREVTKRFRRREAVDSLGELVTFSARRLFCRGGAVRRDDHFTALDDVTFSVPAGQAIGVIGPNGAGKSTILKLLAGILRPDAGIVSVRGRLACLIEVGAGFHGDLTGRENVFLNGTILGMTRAEIRSKLDEIVSFAGLERFMDMPVKRYSSGMYARLGFSIAAHVDPEVLLVDEVLSVGDAVFRLRCLDRMRYLVARGTALVFVTHDLDQMQAICRRAVVLHHGRVSFDGPAGDAAGHYLEAMAGAFLARPTDVVESDRVSPITGLDVRVFDGSGCEARTLRPGDAVNVRLRFHVGRNVARLVCEANLRSSTGQQLISINSGRDDVYVRVAIGVHDLTLSLATVPLAPGRYFWNVRMWDADSGETLVDTPFQYSMTLESGATATGALCLPHEWVVSQHADADVVMRDHARSPCSEPVVAGGMP